MPNISGWYKKKWKAYTPTDEEAKWGLDIWLPLITLLIIGAVLSYCL
jgi:hypothetical protein